jgi:hypothetical protein
LSVPPPPVSVVKKSLQNAPDGGERFLVEAFLGSNLMSMRAIAEEYPTSAIVQQAVGQLPCDSHALLPNTVYKNAHGLTVMLWTL